MALDLLFADSTPLSVPQTDCVPQPGPPNLDTAALQELRDTLTRLHDRVIRLRCEDPPQKRDGSKVTRAQALVYLQAQTDKLAARAAQTGGTEHGWPDPEDVLADGDQIDGLREALGELTCADAPYPAPLPPGCWLLPAANFDVFAAGRLYNGKFSGSDPVLSGSDSVLSGSDSVLSGSDSVLSGSDPVQNGAAQ